MFVLMEHTARSAEKLWEAKVWPSAFLGCPIYKLPGTQIKVQQSQSCFQLRAFQDNNSPLDFCAAIGNSIN